MNTFLLWRARNGQSRRIQPLARHVRVRRRGPRGASLVAALVERVARAAPSARVHGVGIVDVARAGRRGRARIAALGDARARRGPRGVMVRRMRAAVVVDRRSRVDQAALDQRVDGGRDGRLGERELAGELAGPLLAAARSGPAAGTGRSGELGAGPFEHAGEPGEGEARRRSTIRKHTEQFVTPNLCQEVRQVETAPGRLRSPGKPAFTAA